MPKKFYAHSLEGKPVEKWHALDEHLKGTAELASSFAAEFGCGEKFMLQLTTAEKNQVVTICHRIRIMEHSSNSH